MATEQMVRCVRDCVWSKRAIQFFRGDEAMIDPLDPIAMYFDGWAPGTEVYHKERGSSKKGHEKDPVETTRIVPGKIEVKKEEEEPETEKFVKAQSLSEIEAEASETKERAHCPWPGCSDNDGQGFSDETYLKAHITKMHGGQEPEGE